MEKNDFGLKNPSDSTVLSTGTQFTPYISGVINKEVIESPDCDNKAILKSADCNPLEDAALLTVPALMKINPGPAQIILKNRGKSAQRAL